MLRMKNPNTAISHYSVSAIKRTGRKMPMQERMPGREILIEDINQPSP
jgi:hypothetical protein